MKPYERIKHLRKSILNINQESFAKNINISRSNLGNIETDKVKLTDRVINDICEAYSVNKDWILSGNDPIFLEGNDPFVSQIVEMFKTLNKDNRKYLKGYVQRLLEEQSKLSDTANSEKTKISKKQPQVTEHANELTPTDQELEAEADEFAAMASGQAREQFLKEKRQASKASSAKESGVV